MKREFQLNKNLKGFSVVEILVAVAIFGLMAVGLGGTLSYVISSTNSAGISDRATMLAYEGIEAVRTIRNEDYNNLTDGTYGLGINSNKWVLSGTSEDIGRYTREVEITSFDSNTKKVIVNVSWQDQYSSVKSIYLTEYLSDIYREVPPPSGTWTNPAILSSLDLVGNDNGIKIKLDGDYAYILRPGNDDFSVIDVTNPGAPVFIASTQVSSNPVAFEVKNDVLYVITDDNTNKLEIYDISDLNNINILVSEEISSRNSPTDIEFEGDYLYISFDRDNRSDELFVFDVTNPSNPVLMDSIDIARGGNGIYLKNDYVYVTSSSNNAEIQIVDISDKNNLSLVNSYNIPGNGQPDIIKGEDNLIVARDGDDVTFLDITDPINISSVGTYSVNKLNGFDISLSKGLLFAATSDKGAEFKVIDIQNYSSPTILSTLVMPKFLLDLDYAETMDKVFSLSDSNTEELIIIEPQ